MNNRKLSSSNPESIQNSSDPNNNQLKYTSLFASIAAGVYPGINAVAQDQEDGNKAGAIEEIIVTATLRRVEMQDVPQSIQAFSTEDIEANNFTNLQSISNAIPSLTVVSQQAGRNSVVMRGISTGTQEFYTDSQVAIYLDETPLTFNSQQLWPAMVDIERIESLPGPQGTLFGSASQAGTMRIITNKPNHDGVSSQVFGEIMTTDGGDTSTHVNGWINLPLIPDTMSMRLVAYHRDEGGWIDNVPGDLFVQPDPSFKSPGNNAGVVEDDQNTYELKGARASILWDVTENWQAILSTVQESGRSTGHWSWDPYMGEHKVTRFFDDYREDDWWMHSLTIEGDLGFATLTSSTTYLDREIVYEWDNSLYEQYKDSYWGYYWGYGMYNTNYTWGTTFNDQHQDRLSQEIRLTSQGDSRFQWMIGGFYEEIYDEWFFGAKNPDLVDTTAFYYAAYWSYYYAYYGYNAIYPFPQMDIGYSDTLKRTVEQRAIFGEVSFDVTDKLSLTAGGRFFKYDRDEFHQVQFLHNFPVWDPSEYGEGVGGWDWDDFGVQLKNATDEDSVYKFSVNYNWDDDKMIYALWSQGFRLGGQNSLRASNYLDPDGRQVFPLLYEPDYLDNYELGIKSDWLDRRLRVNLVAFRMDFDNYQFNDWDDDGPWWLRGIINGGTVQQQGYELDVTWNATDNLSFKTTYTSIDSENKDMVELPGGTFVMPGDEMSNSPDYKYRFAVDYFFPRPVFGGEMFMHLDYSAQAAIWSSLDASANEWADQRLPSSDLTNFYVGLNMPNDWTLTLAVYNVGDDMWVNSQSSLFPSDSEWFGDPRWRGLISSQRPRSFALNFRKNWR